MARPLSTSTAATPESAEEQYALACSLEKENPKEAVRLYFLAAKNGSAKAQYDLAYILERVNPKEALRLLRRAADNGLADAQYALGYALRGENPEEALRLYRLAADNGSADAQYTLACRLERENPVEAVKLYRLAADNGLAEAQYNLADCLEYGRGVDKKAPEEAVKEYRRAADNGFPKAQLRLGFLLEQGLVVDGKTIVKKDEKEAMKLFRLASDSGYANAQANLAFCLEHGKGIKKNLEEAAELYRRAADQKFPYAQHKLACLLIEGPGAIQKDTTLAIWLFAKSFRDCDGRSADALLSRGLMGFKAAVKKSASNTKLNADQIIEVIGVLSQNSKIASARLAQNQSTLIADLVEVSGTDLSLDDLHRINAKLHTVPGIDVARNASCKTISGIIAGKAPKDFTVAEVPSLRAAGGSGAAGGAGSEPARVAKSKEKEGEGVTESLLGSEGDELIDHAEIFLADEGAYERAPRRGGARGSYVPPSALVEALEVVSLLDGSARSGGKEGR